MQYADSLKFCVVASTLIQKILAHTTKANL